MGLVQAKGNGAMLQAQMQAQLPRQQMVDPRVLTAEISIQTDQVQVTITNIAGSTMKMRLFDMDASIYELDRLMKELKPEWVDIRFLSDDGGEVNKTDQLKAHDRLTVKGLKNQAQMLLEQMQANQKYEEEQDAKFEQYRKAETAKLIQELERERAAMLKELEKAEEKFLFQASDPEIFQKFCRKVEEVKDVPKIKKPSVAVVCPNGVGKSSFINALAETFVTPEGVVDTTTVVSKVYESPTTEYWDVPGCVEERSYTNLRQIMAIKEIHLIIIMCVDRVEHISKLEKFIRAGKVPYLCVRSNVDQIVDVDGGKSASDLTKEATGLEAARLIASLIFDLAKIREGIESLKSCIGSPAAATPPLVLGCGRWYMEFHKPAEATQQANTVPVSRWDVEAVCSFLETLGLGSLAPALRENAVDGLMLQRLSEEDLVAELGFRKLQARKVYERLLS